MRVTPHGSVLMYRIGKPIIFVIDLLCVLFAGCESHQSPQPDPPKPHPTTALPLTNFEFQPNPSTTPTTPQVGSQERLSLLFNNVAESVGILHSYDKGESADRLMVEATGGGVGWLDYDGDGNIDAYFPQGGNPGGTRADRKPDQLFRSCYPDSFIRVTESARLGDLEYSQGVAIGDYNNDGFADVFITNVGPDVLYHNLGDGTFYEITSSAGVEDSIWSSSAAWGDLNVDGNLDLYVCHYCKYDPHKPMPCRDTTGTPAICHPRDVVPSPDECFENLGDGTFRRISQDWGLYGPGNKGLGVAIADYNNDGLPDAYVANDTTPNFLFYNQGKGVFRESALAEGCALSGSGASQASMGIAVADYDNNGYLDIYLTHFTSEHNTLYRNMSSQGFVDVSPETGMRALTLSTLGFGTAMFDFNQDGLIEVFCANGHIDKYNSDREPYEMPPLMLQFDGTRWHDESRKAGSYFQGKYVGRGVACGDFDNDGDFDLLIGHQDSNAALLQNDSPRGSWIKMRLIGRLDNRDAVGARVTVQGKELTRMQQRIGGGSYASAHESSLIFGFGNDSGPYSIEIIWPNGSKQHLSEISAKQSLVVIQPETSNGENP